MDEKEFQSLYPDAQGTVAYWDGKFLGGLIRFDITLATCEANDVTNLGAVVVGGGSQSRCVMQLEAGLIKPGTITLEFLGSPAVSTFSVGYVANLSVSGSWGSVSYPGFPSKLGIGGAVGDLVRATWEFQLI